MSCIQKMSLQKAYVKAFENKPEKLFRNNSWDKGKF